MTTDAGLHKNLGIYGDMWLMNFRRDARPNTYLAYSRAWSVLRRVVSHLNVIQLQSSADVRPLLKALASVGIRPATVRHCLVVLRHVLDAAVEDGYLETNPAVGVRAPKSEEPEVETLSVTEARALLEAARGDEYEALYRLALDSGARVGELLALEWDDVVFEPGGCYIRIRYNLVETSGVIQGRQPLKTKSSRRRVDVGSATAAALAALKLRGGRKTEGVFEGPNGGWLHRTTLDGRFRALLRKANLTHIKFHALRHTCASLLLASGENPKVVQERLGHADVSMTLRRYAHVLPGSQRAVASRMESMLG